MFEFVCEISQIHTASKLPVQAQIYAHINSNKWANDPLQVIEKLVFASGALARCYHYHTSQLI